MSKSTSTPQPDPFERSKQAAEEARRQEALRDYERIERIRAEREKR